MPRGFLVLLVVGCATPRAQTYIECRLAAVDATVLPRQRIRASVTLTNRAATPITIVRRLEWRTAEWIVDGVGRHIRHERERYRPIEIAPQRTDYESPTTADLLQLSRGESWTTTVDVIESARGNRDLVGRPVQHDDGWLLRALLDEPGRHILELRIRAYSGAWSTGCNPITVEVTPEVI